MSAMAYAVLIGMAGFGVEIIEVKPKVFSLDNKSDIQWATQFDYLDYLVLMYAKYVKGE